MHKPDLPPSLPNRFFWCVSLARMKETTSPLLKHRSWSPHVTKSIFRTLTWHTWVAVFRRDRCCLERTWERHFGRAGTKHWEMRLVGQLPPPPPPPPAQTGWNVPCANSPNTVFPKKVWWGIIIRGSLMKKHVSHYPNQQSLPRENSGKQRSQPNTLVEKIVKICQWLC